MRVKSFSPVGTVVLDNPNGEGVDTNLSLGEFGIDNLSADDVDTLLSDCNAADEDKALLLAQKHRL
jgi:hypothetical protein